MATLTPEEQARLAKQKAMSQTNVSAGSPTGSYSLTGQPNQSIKPPKTTTQAQTTSTTTQPAPMSLYEWNTLDVQPQAEAVLPAAGSTFGAPVPTQPTSTTTQQTWQEDPRDPTQECMRNADGTLTCRPKPTGVSSLEAAQTQLEGGPKWEDITADPTAYIPEDATLTGKVAYIDPNAPGTAMDTGVGQVTEPMKVASAGVAGASMITAAPAVQAVSVAPPETLVAQTYNAAQIDPELVGNIEAATGVASVAELRPEELVTAQLDMLLQDLEQDKVPAWAAPAVAEAESMLAARGMSTSSVGRDALFNTIIQAAMPLAQSNATALQQRSALNLSNEQQMAIANLSNEQQTRLANSEQRATALLSNQSADNAAKQFNATSENQTAQFMATMRVQVDTANADRITSTAQFNAEQANYVAAQNAANQTQAAVANAQMATEMAKFNSAQEFQRQQFNAQNALIIEQANVEWQRQVTTANNAIENAATQFDVLNSYNMSNQALVAWGQQTMDEAQWAFDASENAAQRQAMMAAAAAQKSGEIDSSMWEAVGQITAKVID